MKKCLTLIFLIILTFIPLSSSQSNDVSPTIHVHREAELTIDGILLVKDTFEIGASNGGTVQLSRLFLGFNEDFSDIKHDFEVFSNGYLSANPILGASKVFPSRLVVSYKNYPESVDNPYADDPIKSFSAIDVNASDGQEITGMASFFGQSSTGAAQYSSTIIVFKTNSVYAVDIAISIFSPPATIFSPPLATNLSTFTDPALSLLPPFWVAN